jgi:hypothetical protein
MIQDLLKEAWEAGYEAAKGQAVKLAAPYHNSSDGRGCRYLCHTCSDRRSISDKIVNMTAEYPNANS